MITLQFQMMNPIAKRLAFIPEDTLLKAHLAVPMYNSGGIFIYVRVYGRHSWRRYEYILDTSWLHLAFIYLTSPLEEQLAVASSCPERIRLIDFRQCFYLFIYLFLGGVGYKQSCLPEALPPVPFPLLRGTFVIISALLLTYLLTTLS